MAICGHLPSLFVGYPAVIDNTAHGGRQTGGPMAKQDIELLGVFLQSLAAACVNLQIVARDQATAILSTQPQQWYPAAHYIDFLRSLSQRYEHFEPIKERIGAEMMRLWYEHGPGRTVIDSGVGFLRYQTSSAGYHSVVRGPAADIGAFTLEELDETAGRARVRSTSPFDRTMERGILLGGMGLTSDLVYIDVDNAADPSLFHIEFH